VGATTLIGAEAGEEEPPVERLTPALAMKRGRDPLGLEAKPDRIMPTLQPGVLDLSKRAHYLDDLSALAV
jgi:hypothetical protein